MTLFKVWGWIYFAAVIMTLANFGRRSARGRRRRRSAAVGFVVSGVSAWWVYGATMAR